MTCPGADGKALPCQSRRERRTLPYRERTLALSLNLIDNSAERLIQGKAALIGQLRFAAQSTGRPP
jgi:hypothetical protein